MGNGGDEVFGPGHHGDTVGVSGFAGLDLPYVAVGGEVGSQFLNHFDGSAAMGDLEQRRGVEVVFFGPEAPLAGDRAGGIDEDTVEIEEDGSAVELRDRDLHDSRTR